MKKNAPNKGLRKSHLSPLPSRPIPGKLDTGIRKAVEILRKHGIETFESCEGGLGHSTPSRVSDFMELPTRDGVP